MTTEQQRHRAGRHRAEEVLHEVRSTVAGIAAATRLLSGRHGTLDPVAGRRLQGLLETELRRLETLLGCGGEEPPAPLARTVDEVVLSHRIRGAEVAWRPEPCGVVARPCELREALHALLDNAARHAPGTPVTVTARRRGPTAEVRVVDAGPGIPPALRDRVFERGVRAEGSPGQGLGLHLAHRLLAEAGGSIRLLDTGGGAGFLVTVPLEQRGGAGSLDAVE